MSLGPHADEQIARENTRDKLLSVHAMNQSLVNLLLTGIRRGELNENLKREMIGKLAWMADQLREL